MCRPFVSVPFDKSVINRMGLGFVLGYDHSIVLVEAHIKNSKYIGAMKGDMFHVHPHAL
jgi:hypothetical protein